MNERRFDLLEALASAVADTLLERFQPESVTRARAQARGARRPGSTVEFSAVTVTRP